MSDTSTFRFATEAQWKSCLMAGMAANGPGTIGLLPAFACPTDPTFAVAASAAPAWTPAGELAWRDAQAMLHRANDDDEQADAAPPALAAAARIIANAAGLWVADVAGRRIVCFDTGSLARRFIVELPGETPVDIAGDARAGVLVLAQADSGLVVHRIDCAGSLTGTVSLAGLDAARSFCNVRRAHRLVVLSADGLCLYLFAARGGAPLRRLATGSLAACFEADILADDGASRAFLAGLSCEAGMREPHVVALDADIAAVGDIALAEAATGLAANAVALAVTGSRGLYRCAASGRLASSSPALEATLVTPMLESPDTPDAPRWLRIETSARLPAGTTLEIACLSTSDADERKELEALLGDVATPAASRARQVRARAMAQRAPLLYQGDAAQGDGPATFMMPLFGVTDASVWVAATLAASPGSELPAIESLSVRYPGRSLMERLPALYRRPEIQPDTFLRSLVGVLEATTDDLDARIVQMGRSADPRHASVPWLDFIARWLGLPWDDAMDEPQKRCIVLHAHRIAKGRGTRDGLQALLECLLGAGRFRIVDTTVDHGLARVGSSDCAGSFLPAILSGLPPSAAFLGVQAALGTMRLPCAGARDDDSTSRFLGEIRVDVAAGAHERERWEPWLRSVLASMLPAGTRVRMRWIAARTLRGDGLGEDLVLGEPPYGRLGTDAVLGASRVRPGGSTLPSVQGADGPTLQ